MMVGLDIQHSKSIISVGMCTSDGKHAIDDMGWKRKWIFEHDIVCSAKDRVCNAF